MARAAGTLKKLALAIGLVAALAGCQSAGDNGLRPISTEEFATPLQPGQTRIRLKGGADTDRWRVERLQSSLTRYVCKALACSAPTLVVFGRGASTTTKPNPEALRKLGEASLARARAGTAASDGVQHYQFQSGHSTVGSFKGYPAVIIDEVGTFDGKPRHTHRVIAVCGGITVVLSAISEERAAARAAFDEFSAKIDIQYRPLN